MAKGTKRGRSVTPATKRVRQAADATKAAAGSDAPAAAPIGDEADIGQRKIGMVTAYYPEAGLIGSSYGYVACHEACLRPEGCVQVRPFVFEVSEAHPALIKELRKGTYKRQPVYAAFRHGGADEFGRMKAVDLTLSDSKEFFAKSGRTPVATVHKPENGAKVEVQASSQGKEVSVDLEPKDGRWDTELKVFAKAIVRAWQASGGTATKVELREEISKRPKLLRRAEEAEQMLQDTTEESWEALVLEYMKIFGTKTGERRGEGKGFVVYAMNADAESAPT